MQQPYSIVSYRGLKENYRCGYCHGFGKVSDGMWAHCLSVQDYQDLIDRGWRRSGKYTYKPAMAKTCCPQYTIRCTAADFKLSRSQKKVIKHFNRYINTDVDEKKGVSPSASEAGREANVVPAERMVGPDWDESRGAIDLSRVQEPPVSECAHAPSPPAPTAAASSSAATAASPGSSPVMAPSHTKLESGVVGDKESGSVVDEAKRCCTPKAGSGADPNRPACRKAKDIRRERWLQKHTDEAEPQAKTNKPNDMAKTLEQFLGEITPDSKHKFEVRLVRSSPRSVEFSDSFEESYAVYKKYQMAIHGDPPDKPTRRQFTNFLVASPLQVRLVRSSPRSDEFNASLDESYNVYRRYQITIHNDAPADCDKNSFLSFLVKSPLEPQYTPGGFPDGYGSFHQQYLMDGRIVAVGVLDILPACVSSVYLYYDPDFAFLSIGTYSALQELAFTRRLATMEPALQYYYMGFYIHSCPKMRYKGQYVPSFILCPETYNWIPIDKCRPKLDEKKYSRLDDSMDIDDADKPSDLGKVLILWHQQALPFEFYTLLNPENQDEAQVFEYACLVGRTCAQRMLLVRS